MCSVQVWREGPTSFMLFEMDEGSLGDIDVKSEATPYTQAF